jgi:hypothetical protein
MTGFGSALQSATLMGNLRPCSSARNTLRTFSGLDHQTDRGVQWDCPGNKEQPDGNEGRKRCACPWGVGGRIELGSGHNGSYGEQREGVRGSASAHISC